MWGEGARGFGGEGGGFNVMIERVFYVEMIRSDLIELWGPIFTDLPAPSFTLTHTPHLHDGLHDAPDGPHYAPDFDPNVGLL